MQKQAPTLGRLLVMVGFALSCFGLILFLWLAFGGAIPLSPKGYRFQASFSEGTQLAKEADVRISGVSVGKVKTIVTTDDGRSDATIQLDARYAPLPKDTKAILRQKTLLGETYVELTPGNGKKAGWLKEDGTLPETAVGKTVELDEIFRAFDPKTRAAFQSWMQTQAVALKGRGQDISDAFGNLAPFAHDANTVVQILDTQLPDVRRLVNNTGVVFNALTARDSQLRSLIENSDKVFSTTASRDADLQEIFRVLPTFESEASKTTKRLDSYARNTNPLVTKLKPAAKELSPTLQQLNLLAPDLKGLFRSLGPLIDESKRGIPATTRFIDDLHPLLASFDAPLKELNPVLSYIGLYKEELNAFFSNTVAATSATDRPANATGVVHYLRTTNPVNAENLAVYPRRLPSNRPNPYQLPGAFRDLAKGLLSYETRQCDGSGGLPSIVSVSSALASVGGITAQLPAPLNQLSQSTLTTLETAVPQTLVAQILKLTFAAGTTPIAPPCKQQGTFTTKGGTTQFPHLVADPTGTSSGPVQSGR